MRRINIAAPRFTYDDADPEGFRSGAAKLGELLGGAEESGISVYELPPGQAVCPYHYECGEEEWLLVLEGNPTLRHPEGSERLRPWGVAFLEKGPGRPPRDPQRDRGDGPRADVPHRGRPHRNRLPRQRQGRRLDRRPRGRR